ncbi:MAG: quinoprotein relay system zinc metallohydrolase 1 [Hyphomicrobiaceae bacterium]|nr:quinoprotein relay system zinc metallohydrolase 1 [Hyphomicrobiaceae bacterium]
MRVGLHPGGTHRLDRRRLLAGAGALLGGVPLYSLLPVFLAEAAPLTYPVEPVAIGPGAWVVYGAREAITSANGGAIANIGILDSEAGAIIIDTGPSKRFGEALRGVAMKLTGKPVVRVYLTHFHPDHVFGNQAFAPEIIAAPEAVIDGLRQLGEDFASAMYHAAGDWMRGTEVALPGRVIPSGQATNWPVEDFGGRRLRLLPLMGHTASDLAVFDETSGLLFAGDLAFLDRAPTTPHADLDNWRASLASLGVVSGTVVPGHGPVEAGTRAIDQTRDWLDMIEGRIGAAFERGLSMTEAMTDPLPEWTRRIALARYEFQRSVMHVYPKLEAGTWPRVDRSVD